MEETKKTMTRGASSDSSLPASSTAKSRRRTKLVGFGVFEWKKRI